MSIDEVEQEQLQGQNNNNKQPLITTNAIIEATTTAIDAHVIVDNISQDKEHKWESSPPRAVVARNVKIIITNGSNHVKQFGSNSVLHQEQDDNSLADPIVTKIKQAFVRGSLICETTIPFEVPP